MIRLIRSLCAPGNQRAAVRSIPQLTFAVLLLLHIAGAEAAAARLTGMLIYSADDLGNPNGFETFAPGAYAAHTWRSLVVPGVIWYGLGLIPGSPPENLQEPFLNTADFSVDLDLPFGESQFTVLVEPGVLTESDDFERWALNLYFNGHDDEPGIAVIVPRYGDPGGSPPTSSQANPDQVYSLDIRQVDAPTPFFYEDEHVRVTVVGFSLLPPALAGLSVDRLRPYSFTSSGTDEFVGVLTLHVENSKGSSGDGCALSRSNSAGHAAWFLLIVPLLLGITKHPLIARG